MVGSFVECFVKDECLIRTQTTNGIIAEAVLFVKMCEHPLVNDLLVKLDLSVGRFRQQ